MPRQSNHSMVKKQKLQFTRRQVLRAYYSNLFSHTSFSFLSSLPLLPHPVFILLFPIPLHSLCQPFFFNFLSSFSSPSLIPFPFSIFLSTLFPSPTFPSAVPLFPPLIPIPHIFLTTSNPS